ncbi:MAG: molybdopterin oxidoreductase [Planctomycetota bacterium]|nr:MAG: molybdopterin oxidoreductase [Planctomycetota bacterium]
MLPRFWRSLEELQGSPEFEDRLAREFPRLASVWDDGVTDRRRFLSLMAASMALAGMHGCSSPPPEPILPYVRQPAELTPGIPLHFATAMPGADGAIGLVVRSDMGRPTKVEGNPLHPASLGATDAWAQASLLTLYDPDRSQTVLHRGVISTWGEAYSAAREAMSASRDGAGVHVISPPITSPTLARQQAALLAAYPQAQWHVYEAASRDNARAGALLAFGEDRQPIYRFADADVVLAIDADFCSRGGGRVRYARDFMSRRGAESRAAANRLYVVESMYTPTGAAADHRLPLAPSEIEQFVRALAARLGVEGVSSGLPQGVDQRWIDAVAADLEQRRGRSLLLAGLEQPAAVHALVHAMNERLGNFGATVEFIAPISGRTFDSAASLRELVDALNAGAVQLLLALDCNPVYDAPPGLAFLNALRKAKQAIHFGLYDDETSRYCHWHIPANHYLESWSDVRAYDGTVAIVQPLIAPLYEGKTVHELMSALVDPAPQTSYDAVRATWQTEWGDQFDRRWHEALRDGAVANTQFEPATPALAADLAANLPPPGGAGEGYELVLSPDPAIGDGRWANNAWLQELPKPLSKLTWENALFMAPATADRLGLATEDVVTVRANGQAIDLPVCAVPGHAERCVSCHLGYGRTRSGRIGTGIGANAFALRTPDGGYIVRGAELTATGGTAALAITQKHHVIDGRNIVHSGTVEAYEANPHSVLPNSVHHPLPTLLPEYQYDGFAWGMAIDLSKCMGCNACVIACQAENNVPVVGKEAVILSREMHWLRLDVYYAGPPENPDAVTQPMLCQHCEKAPCEYVCPVAATTHSDEGLNEMTYNRCIGTRYCSNNCPYKVRRFNFFQWSDVETPVLKLLRNPEVTVRNRGVMEKCTYCVQRINKARIDAKKIAVETGEKPRLEDGVLQTACQQACPSQAIVFGDINDPHSRVAKLKADPRSYGVLSELGTQPRTSYLARLKNPNPRLAAASAEPPDGDARQPS